MMKTTQQCCAFLIVPAQHGHETVFMIVTPYVCNPREPDTHVIQKRQPQDKRTAGARWAIQQEYPFTPKCDQIQIPPAASPEILHHTWLFIVYSDERWLQFSIHHNYIIVPAQHGQETVFVIVTPYIGNLRDPILMLYVHKLYSTGIWVGGFGRLNETLTLFKTRCIFCYPV